MEISMWIKKWLVPALAAAALSAQAQTGYQIDITVAGLRDTTAFLGYYYGEQAFLRDTARVGPSGRFVFDGKKSLSPGVYFVALDKTPIFDLVISEDQFFSVQTTRTDYVSAMKISGDTDNELFYRNMMFNKARNEEAEPIVKILKDSTLKEDQKTEAREAFKKINERVLAHQKELIEKYPATLTARILKSQQPIDVPEPPKRADGAIDSAFQYRYYKTHFFDNFNLADEALIRTPKPVYRDKVYDYLDRLVPQQRDSLFKEIRHLANRAKANQETYKYLVFQCLLHYQQPKIMGLDEVFVDLYDTYYATGEMDFWATKEIKKSLKDYADKIRLNMMGKVAPDLKMQDSNFQPRSLYDIKKRYTIIYFFDPECGHCKTETPRLVEFYNKNKAKYDLDVFAVSIDTSMAKMRNFIKEMKTPWVTVNGPRTYVGPYNKLYWVDTTPTVYIIDEKKKIIARKLPVENFENFFSHYEKYIRKQPPPGKGT
jgi:thiol-disulfide isomerase/thioredoxin